jgi:hypothetical protein
MENEKITALAGNQTNILQSAKALVESDTWLNRLSNTVPT